MAAWEAILLPLIYLAYYGFGVFLLRASLSPASARPDRATLFTVAAGSCAVRFWNVSYKGVCTELCAQADFPSAGRVELMPERVHDRLLKGIGFASELRTGYAHFDARCYVMAEHRDFALALLRDTRRRDAVLRLLDDGATHVLFTAGAVTAVFPLAGPRAVSQSDADRFAWDLAELARPPAPAVSERDRRTARVALARRVLAHGLALVPFFAWVLMRLDPHEYPLVDADQWTPLGLKFLGGALIAILGGATLLLWGQAQAWRDLVAIGFLAVVAMGMQSDDVAVWLNARLDRTPPLVRVAQVVDNQQGSRYLGVNSWRLGRHYEQVRVPAAVHREARPGIDKLRVATRPGAFGVEWIVDAQLVAGEAPERTVLDPKAFEELRYQDAMLASQARWPEIVALWDAFLAEHPDHGGAYLERAGTHRRTGNMAAAMQDLARACELGEKRACGILKR